MNLLEIATVIGQRLGTNTSDPNSRDGQAVRAFTKMRHDQMYRAFLWRDSLIEYAVPIDPNAANYLPTNPYLPTKGHLILPPIFQHVVACRTSDNRLDVQRPMIYFRANQDEFSRTGTPLDFYLLSKCVWELDTALDLVVQSIAVADNGVTVTVDLLQSAFAAFSRFSVAASAAGSEAGTGDCVENFLKPATQNAINLGHLVLSQGQNLIPANATFGGSSYQFQSLLVAGTQYTITWGASELSLQYGVYPNTTTINNPGAGTTTTFLYPAGGNFAVFFYGQGNGPVTAQVAQSVTQSVSSIITLQAADVAAPKLQRIRFVPIPNVATTIRVLGKRTPPPFSAESDSPGINGLDAILVALGYYDFCHRDERGGTPETDKSVVEAVGPRFLADGVPGGFLKHLIDEEVIQAAHNSRIMPELGYGDPTYYGAQEYQSKGWF